MTPGRRSIPAEVEATYRGNGWWRDDTLLDDFLARAEERPDAMAVVSYRVSQQDPERHTYGELELLSRRCAAALSLIHI